MDDNLNNLGYLLNKSSNLMKWELNRELEKLELTASQWAVLKDVHVQSSLGENTTPASIALRLNVERPTMSGIINRLLKGGWIKVIKNPEDKRSQIIKLTERAEEIILKAEMINIKIIEQALNGFSKKDIQDLYSYLARIIDNL
ncbi:MarR family transcriptional regulator [Clostridium bovifaecis]|uniref:MarR family transcriptional regulator n=1 Tax=Clostridium bovifaecis TaxID=2184719 RepID=A0A6I6F7P6_9CLOT|nr:MarR family transcriptional regulator [Clostridium bovifaecis]